MNDKTVVYYTCNTHKPEIDDLGRKYLSKTDLPIVAVSLNRALDFGDVRLTTQGDRSPLMMHKQVVMGLEAVKTKYVFTVESDVLYHLSHFEFTPGSSDTFYFNHNVWKWKWPERHFIWTDNCEQLSGMSGQTDLLLDFFKGRVKQIEQEGFNRHYEPRGKRGNYMSRVPIICIRHDRNITKSKWSPADYRNPEYAKGWKEASVVPGWEMI